MRYFGMSLGMAIAPTFSAAIGTLLLPAVSGALATFVQTNSGLATLGGVMICMLGIAVVGFARHMRKRQTADRGQAAPEFNLRKGIAIAILSGAMSSCFNYGLASGNPIRELSLAAGTDPLMQSLPALVVVLLGGFTTNFVWSIILIVKNGAAGQFSGEAAGAPAGADTGDVVQKNAALAQLSTVHWRRRDLVFAVLFLLPRRSSDGSLRFRKLDAAHVQHHHLFQPLGVMLKEWKGASTLALVRF
jgi:L-rhamnose-H+ transport protein